MLLLDAGLDSILQLEPSTRPEKGTRFNVASGMMDHCMKMSLEVMHGVARKDFSNEERLCTLRKLAASLLSPLPLPEYFFVSRSQVSFQLSTEPMGKEIVMITRESGLMLHLEGIVEAPASVLKIRPLHSAIVTVESCFKRKIDQDTAELSLNEKNSLCPQLTLSVPCNQGYFATNCQLGFSDAVSALHSNRVAQNNSSSSSSSTSTTPSFKVSIRTSLKDTKGHIWNCGSTKTLEVVVKTHL